MKKYIGLFAILFVVVGVLVAGITNFPNGVAIGTEAEEATADVTPGDDDLYIAGTLEVDGAGRFDAALDISAAFTQDGALIQEPAAVVQVDTATTVTATDSFILVIGSNTTTGEFAVTNTAAFLSTATANAVNGQIVEIMGTSATATVTLTDDSDALQMDGSTVVLALGGSVRFRYYNSTWYMMDQQVNVID